MKAKLTSLFLLLAAPLLHAQATPTLMSYQGRVTDAGGVLIGNTTPVNRAVTFSLYSASSGETPLYAETQSVTISGGEFSVLIGNGTGISGLPGPSSPATSPYKSLSDIVNSGTYSNLYLGITVDDGTTAADIEISPRQQMVSGAFALRAKVAESVAGSSVTTEMMRDKGVTTDKIAPSAVDSSRILDASIVSTDIANNTITAGKLDTTTVGVWTPVGSSVYRTSNVGIGEKNPGFPLNFESSWGDKISLWGNSGTHVGLGVQAGLLQIYGGNSGDDIGFGYGKSDPASFTETMRIKGTGNVGIGTKTPAEKLVVAGTAQADKLYSNGTVRARGGSYGTNGTNTGFSFDGNGDADGGMFSGADGILQFYTNSTEKLRISTAGYLGIGTTAPAEKVSIQDGRLWFTTATGNGDNGGIGGTMASNDMFRIYGLGSDNNGALYIDTYDDANEPIIFRQVSGQAYERMRIAANGYVGISHNNPQAPLHVGSYNYNTFNLDFYVSGNGGHDDNTQNVSWLPHSIISDYGIQTGGRIDIASDSRIKTIVSRSEGAEDLQLLLALQVTNYQQKDSYRMGPAMHKKVIAQEVEAIFPQAVSKSVGVVPDIFKKAVSKDGWVALKTDLQVGDRVRLVGDNSETVEEVLEVREDGFRTAFKAVKNDIFVYGREVKDFRSVDYDAIAMLNVSATQQLKKEKDAEINALKSKNAELEARLSALEKLTADN